jgi:nicotinamidase-related amidase
MAEGGWLGPNAAHLCIDMQRLFSSEGPWRTPWMERVLPQVTALASAAPQRTIFTRFIPPKSADEAPGMWRAYYHKWPNVTRDVLDPSLLELVPQLKSLAPPAHVIDRPVYSAFGGGALQAYLTEHHIDTLIVTGSETDVCVLASVLAAIDRGYRVVIAEDGVCSSADETHDALMALYRSRFDVQIILAKIEAIRAAWNGDGTQAAAPLLFNVHRRPPCVPAAK